MEIENPSTIADQLIAQNRLGNLTESEVNKLQLPDVLIVGAFLIAWNFWFTQRLQGLLLRTSWLWSPLKFGARIIITVFATYTALAAGRVLGYPPWAQSAFVILAALSFVVMIRTELGRHNPRHSPNHTQT